MTSLCLKRGKVKVGVYYVDLCITLLALAITKQRTLKSFGLLTYQWLE